VTPEGERETLKETPLTAPRKQHHEYPSGVAVLVLIVRIEEHAGLQEVKGKDPLASGCSPWGGKYK
jgi:hypothetical protein